MIIAFCNMDKEGDESAINMIASGLGVQTMKDVSVLMLESGFGKHHVEDAISKKTEIMVKEPFAYMEGEGMDYLMKKSSNHMLSEKNIGDGIVYVKEDLGYIPGAVKKSRMMYEMEFKKECQNILKELDKMADYIFVDCAHAADSVRQKIMEQADLIVVNVSQQEKVLDEYFSYPTALWNKTVYCIGNYIGEEPCNLKNIQRLYRIDNKQIGVIPYNVEFLASMRKGKALSFFQNYHLRARNYRNKEFFGELFKLSNMIIQWEELNNREKEN